MKTRLITAITTLCVAGCFAPHDADFVSSPADDSIQREGTSVTDLVLQDGATLRFIAEPDRIGVLEINDASSPSLLSTLALRENLTALEIYLTAGGTAAPHALVADHAASSDREARAQAVPASLKSQACPSTGAVDDGFHNWFLGQDPFTTEHGHGWNLEGELDGVTGPSDTRALGACVPNVVCTPFLDCEGGEITIHTQVGKNLWFQINGTKTEMPPNRRVVYYSSGFSFARYKISMRDIGDLSYHLEGSW